MEKRQTEKYKTIWATVSNFWDYDKWKVLLVCFLIAVAVYGIRTTLAQKETAFSGALVNCVSLTDADLAEAFAQHEGLDIDTYAVVFQDNISLAENYSSVNMMTLQSLFAQINAGEIDFLAADSEVFKLFAYNISEVFPDLRNYLDEDTFGKLSGQLYYIDKALLPKIYDVAASEETYSAMEYPNPYHPETMEDPIPVGIDISQYPIIRKNYGFGGASLYLGIIGNTAHPETVVHFIEFVLEQS